jgi:predicted enzyme related to lactoylglutathione lyase
LSENHLIHHEISYVELSVTDMSLAQRFYGSAFGWEFTDYAPVYAGIQRLAGEGESGGINVVEKVDSGGPLVLLYSDNLESSLQSVLKAGGTVVQEIISYPGGRRFRFADPFGNVLGVFTTKGGEPLT